MFSGFPFGSSNLSNGFTLNNNDTPKAKINVNIREDVIAIQIPLLKKP
jgi:hypothetical protein